MGPRALAKMLLLNENRLRTNLSRKRMWSALRRSAPAMNKRHTLIKTLDYSADHVKKERRSCVPRIGISR